MDYASIPLAPQFAPGLAVARPSGTNITVLSRLTYPDGSSYRFNYTTDYGQIWRIQHYAADGATLLTQTSYSLQGGAGLTDCPRFGERREWARLWRGDTDGVWSGAEDAITTYAVASDAANAQQPAWSQATTPDGVTVRETYHNLPGTWRYGLPEKSEVIFNSVVKKTTAFTWTQSDPSLTYPDNPHLQETTITDEFANKRRTSFTYNSYDLPEDVVEYAADALTVLRRAHTEYNLYPTYLARNVIGLVDKRELFDGQNNLLAKTSYDSIGAATF